MPDTQRLSRRSRPNVLLIGFAGAFRRSELVALDCEHVEITRDGLVITIRRSKTIRTVLAGRLRSRAAPSVPT